MTTSSLGTPFLQDAPYPGPAAGASGILSGAESSGHVLMSLREDPDFTLYGGRQHGYPSPILVVALTREQPSPQTLRRLEHEYSLAANSIPLGQPGLWLSVVTKGLHQQSKERERPEE
jgi:hypothetical protein